MMANTIEDSRLVWRRALAQRVEVDTKKVRIMGAKSVLLRTLLAASGAKTAGFGVPSFVPKWRARRDSNS
jgi:site-specific DNA recombinase